MAATTQIEAAVVNPEMVDPVRRMAPAPKKPIPLITCAARRAGSIRTLDSVANSPKP
ncbi:hypothetical protein D3C73_1493930 [compost metagenome]